MVVSAARTSNRMMPNACDTRVVGARAGSGTGDTIVTYEDRDGNRHEKTFECGTAVSISCSKYGSEAQCYPNKIEVTRTVVPEFKDEKTKYWSPPKPPRNPKKLPEFRDDRRAKRIVPRPEFHARSNPRPR